MIGQRASEDSSSSGFQADVLGDVSELVGRKYGLDVRSHYRKTLLEQSVERRQADREIRSSSQYRDLLRTDEKELAALYRDFLVGTPRFFRDPEFWEQLGREVIPAFLKRRAEERPLKIWVPGCASGEEAYSLAMVFLEQLQEHGCKERLQIFATDVDEDGLARGRSGVYSSTIAQDVSPERLERFFLNQGTDFSVGRELRQSVTFAAHDLLSDPPFSQLDFLSCRDVLGRLEPHAKKKCLELFHFGLLPGGLLVLGHSERTDQSAHLFEPVSKRLSLFRRAEQTPAYVNWPAKGGFLRRMPSATAPDGGSNVSRAIELLVMRRYTHACVVVSDSLEILSFFGPTGDYLTQPTGEARMNLLAWTRPALYARLGSALEQARRQHQPVVISDIRLDGDRRRIQCTVEPVSPLPGERPVLLVSFRDLPEPSCSSTGHEEGESRVRRLEADLETAVEQLEEANEQYRTNHEEFCSLNEKLQASNEELQASREELRSLNEEVSAINRQLERKNVELGAAYAELNNLVLSTQIPLIFLDRDLCVRRYTPPATELMNLRPSDEGRPIWHIKERFDDGDLAGDAQKVLETRAPLEEEVSGKDGRWFLRGITACRTEDERVDGVCVAFHDITETKKAALRLEEARMYAESLLRTVPTPLLVLDGMLRVASANDAFYDSFQLKRDEAVGVCVYDLEQGSWNMAELRELLEQVLPEQKLVKDYEVTHHFNRIGRRVMHINGQVMEWEKQPDSILLAIDDVTAEATAIRATEERASMLLQEHHRKDEFLAMLGHELRNPLAAFMHGLDLLELADDPSTVEHVRGMMRRQSRRIANMLDQLLDVARLGSGKVEMERFVVNMEEVVKTAMEGVTPFIEARSHELSLSLPGEEVLVLGDLARLTQVIENLVTNAAKYMDRGGRIDLSLEANRESVWLRVRDTGIGIEQDLLPRIFDVFIQAPRALDRAEGGLGLGLSLVKRVVEMHGGNVEASSEGPGRGSEFVVTLPRMLKRRSSNQPRLSARLHEISPLKVLIVDDEEDSAAMLGRILELQGQEVRTVHDGVTAVELNREYNADVVLLDLGLPQMDGYEVARRLRSEYGNDIFVVALTGYQKDPDLLAKAEFDEHLLKPPDMTVLSQWLVQWAQGRQT